MKNLISIIVIKVFDNIEKHGKDKECEVFIINTDKFFINAQKR